MAKHYSLFYNPSIEDLDGHLHEGYAVSDSPKKMTVSAVKVTARAFQFWNGPRVAHLHRTTRRHYTLRLPILTFSDFQNALHRRGDPRRFDTLALTTFMIVLGEETYLFQRMKGQGKKSAFLRSPSAIERLRAASPAEFALAFQDGQGVIHRGGGWGQPDMALKAAKLLKKVGKTDAQKKTRFEPSALLYWEGDTLVAHMPKVLDFAAEALLTKGKALGLELGQEDAHTYRVRGWSRVTIGSDQETRHFADFADDLRGLLGMADGDHAISDVYSGRISDVRNGHMIDDTKRNYQYQPYDISPHVDGHQWPARLLVIHNKALVWRQDRSFNGRNADSTVSPVGIVDLKEVKNHVDTPSSMAFALQTYLGDVRPDDVLIPPDVDPVYLRRFERSSEVTTLHAATLQGGEVATSSDPISAEGLARYGFNPMEDLIVETTGDVLPTPLDLADNPSMVLLYLFVPKDKDDYEATKRRWTKVGVVKDDPLTWDHTFDVDRLHARLKGQTIEGQVVLKSFSMGDQLFARLDNGTTVLIGTTAENDTGFIMEDRGRAFTDVLIATGDYFYKDFIIRQKNVTPVRFIVTVSPANLKIPKDLFKGPVRLERKRRKGTTYFTFTGAAEEAFWVSDTEYQINEELAFRQMSKAPGATAREKASARLAFDPNGFQRVSDLLASDTFDANPVRASATLPAHALADELFVFRNIARKVSGFLQKSSFNHPAFRRSLMAHNNKFVRRWGRLSLFYRERLWGDLATMSQDVIFVGSDQTGRENLLAKALPQWLEQEHIPPSAYQNLHRFIQKLAEVDARYMKIMRQLYPLGRLLGSRAKKHEGLRTWLFFVVNFAIIVYGIPWQAWYRLAYRGGLAAGKPDASDPQVFKIPFLMTMQFFASPDITAYMREAHRVLRILDQHLQTLKPDEWPDQFELDETQERRTIRIYERFLARAFPTITMKQGAP